MSDKENDGYDDEAAPEATAGAEPAGEPSEEEGGAEAGFEDRREEAADEPAGEFEASEELTPSRLETIAWESANTAKEILSYFPRIQTPKVSSRVVDGSVWVEMEGDPTGRLIGRKGKTIEAFQHILSKIMSHRLRRKITIHVDAEGYKGRYREKLVKLAHQTADYVAATGSARALEPMSAADRRTGHITLKERPDVVTASEGKDDNRFVVIWPRQDK